MLVVESASSVSHFKVPGGFPFLAEKMWKFRRGASPTLAIALSLALILSFLAGLYIGRIWYASEAGQQTRTSEEAWKAGYDLGFKEGNRTGFSQGYEKGYKEGYMQGAYEAMSAKGQISIEAFDLVKQTDGTTTFSITVKNTGNKPAKSLTVKLANEAAQNLQVAGSNVSADNPLQPGQSATLIYAPSGTYIVGNSYNFVVSAQFTDGSMFTKTDAVTCRYG